jgi:hypothetical protein
MINANEPWKDALPEAITWFNVLTHEVDREMEGIFMPMELECTKMTLPKPAGHDVFKFNKYT